MTTDDPVRRALASIAEADASRHAPPHLERAVLEALDARLAGDAFRQRLIPRLRYQPAAAIVLVMAAIAAMYFGVMGEVAERRVPAPADVSPRPHTRPVRADVGAYAAVDQGGVAQRMIVRLPRSMLAMLGVPVINPDAPGTVNLEVTVGHDGLAQTIRILP
jgi:hypothetical protein